MKVLTTAAATKLANCDSVKSVDLSKRTSRTSDLTSFAMILSHKMNEIHPKSRLVMMASPKRGGNVFIVMHVPNHDALMGITYKADGSWSEVYSSKEGQV